MNHRCVKVNSNRPVSVRSEEARMGRRTTGKFMLAKYSVVRVLPKTQMNKFQTTPEDEEVMERFSIRQKGRRLSTARCVAPSRGVDSSPVCVASSSEVFLMPDSATETTYRWQEAELRLAETGLGYVVNHLYP